MKIVDLKIKRYDLPLVKPLTINGKTIDQRSGVIIFLTDTNGFVGCGETAPLPGLHKESLSGAISQLKSLKKIIPGQLNDLFSSVRLGIEMAMFNLQRQTDNILATKTVDINALVMADDDVNSLLSQGYSTIKIKVGRASIEEDIEMLRMIGSKVRLRLDANRSWSLAEAITFCREIGPAPIEYIEEPLKNIADLAAFVEATNMPVALDETIVEQGINNLKYVDAFVLKPSLVGGFDKTTELIKFAKENNKKVCLSSTFETSIGIEAFAAFAAHSGLTDTAHGLDTGKYLGEDLLIKPVNISNGAIEILQSPPSPANLRMDLLNDVP